MYIGIYLCRRYFPTVSFTLYIFSLHIIRQSILRSQLFNLEYNNIHVQFQYFCWFSYGHQSLIANRLTVIVLEPMLLCVCAWKILYIHSDIKFSLSTDINLICAYLFNPVDIVVFVHIRFYSKLLYVAQCIITILSTIHISGTSYKS